MRLEHDGYGTADLHLHTDCSDGMASVEEVLDFVEYETSLDVVAITDHDTMAGSERARDIAARKRYSFEVVAGVEITTLEGHLLALFIEGPVPSYRAVLPTIEAIHARGGLAVVPHPMSWLTRSLGERSIDRIMANRDPALQLDGVEVYNPSIAGRVTQRRVRRLNKERYQMAETGSSDAHFLGHVGAGYTIFPGRSAAELRTALQARTTIGSGYRAQEVGLDQLAAQQVRSLVVWPTRLATRAARRLLARGQTAHAHHRGCDR